MDNKGSNPIKDLLLLKNLYKAYRKLGVDVVLHFTIKPNIYGTIAATLAGIPCVSNITGLGTVFIRDNMTSKIAKLMYKVALRYPKVVFFQNPDDRQLFLDQKLVKKEITDILPGSGINLKRFVPKPKEAFTRNKPFKFLMIARLLYDKGIIEFIEAIQIVKKTGLEVRFQLLGKIEDVASLGVSKAQVDGWQKQGIVDYLGTTTDVRPFIDNADCVVLPSYREGTPRTLLEAAALAKPLIATDVPGCREVVIDQYNGFTCKVKNAQDLAEKMIAMASASKENLAEMGENSRQLVEEKFDENIVIDKYFQAICKCFGIERFNKQAQKSKQTPVAAALQA
jgi:glycosyltransferase involved in cell wall biosynthesis